MTTFPIDQQTPQSTNLLEQGRQFIKSDESANPDGEGEARYGQNGYAGPSSDLPGRKTTSGFLPECKVSKDFRTESDWQTRKVNSAPLAAAHGMKPRANGGTVPNKTARPVTKGI